jgi:hypothetical protein
MEHERNYIFNAREQIWHARNHLAEAEMQYEGVFASSDRSADQVFSLLDADWDDPEECVSDEDQEVGGD